MTAPQTVNKEKVEETNLTFKLPLQLEYENNFTVKALGVERSYEDRDVYFRFNDKSTWLRAEDAIALGQALIEHGSKSFLINMYNHQRLHAQSLLKRHLSEGRIEKVVMEKLDEKPVGYGEGFKLFRISAIYFEGKKPEFSSDLSYEDVIYFSPYEHIFKYQLGFYGENVEFINYNWEEEREKFFKLAQD